LRSLFGVDARVTNDAADTGCRRFFLGLASDAHIRRLVGSIPELSSQGHLIRRVDPQTMILAGGSSTAAAWAIYELVERYGVRYLLHEDVLPERPGELYMPSLDTVFEPIQKIRCWQVSDELAFGPVVWSLQQQKDFIDQIFKLKFNGIYFCVWPQHPFLDYSVRGLRRSAWTMLLGQRIPIDEETIGREHLWENMPLLTNPELRGANTFDEALTAGRRLLNGILDHAQSRGLHTCIAFQPMEFPNEFRGLLQKPTEDAIQAGGLSCAEQGDLNSPGHRELMLATFDAYLEQWGRVDELEIKLPEHPQTAEHFPAAWRDLSDKYNLEPDYDGEALVLQARESGLVAGTADRAEREFKSTIVMLHFFDRFFRSGDLMERLATKNIELTVGLGGSSEGVLPFLDRILWPGAGMRTWLDYTASRAVRRLGFVERLDALKVPASLVVTLQDDNIGWLPQVATENLHHLLQTLQQNGWRGYYTRFWPIGDLDPTVAYLARASWDSRTTPRAAYEDHFTKVYGADCTEVLSRVMRLLEDATVILDVDFLSLFFPVPGIMSRHVDARAPMAEGLYHIRAIYECARGLLNRLAESSSRRIRQGNLDYWIGRLDFAVEALNELRLLREGGAALRAAQSADDRQVRAKQRESAVDCFQRGIASGESALRSAARNIRDDSDRGAVAAYHHFFVREVRRRVQEVLDQSASPDTG
jgi:hypothetical protein